MRIWIVTKEAPKVQPLVALLQALPFPAGGDSDCPATVAVMNLEAAAAALGREEIDLWILHAPDADKAFRRLALKAAADTSAGVLCLLREGASPAIVEELECGGVPVLCQPFTKQPFVQAVRLSLIGRWRLQALRKEKEKLQDKLSEMRLIHRAKCTLIDVLHLTEPQAHRYIEKQAMDRRISRLEVAEGILKTYET